MSIAAYNEPTAKNAKFAKIFVLLSFAFFAVLNQTDPWNTLEGCRIFELAVMAIIHN